MRCDQVQNSLNAYVRGELTPDVYRALETHLRACLHCRAILHNVDSMAAMLAPTSTPPPPRGFADRVMAAAQKRQAVENVEAWNLLRWWQLASVPMHAAAVAILVIGLALGLMMGYTAVSSMAPTPAVARVYALETYDLDFLGAAPAGSLAHSYLTFVSDRNGGSQ